MLKTKTKSNEPVRQPKRNKRKKRRNQLVLADAQVIPKQQIKAIGGATTNNKQSAQPTINVVWNQDLFRKGDTAQIISAKAPTGLMSSVNKYLPDHNVMVYQLSNSVPHASKIQIQNIISMGENSSAYESSEDTGVGELSESELITTQDGIGTFYARLLFGFQFCFFFLLFRFKRNSSNSHKFQFFPLCRGGRTEIPLGDARLLEEHDLTNVLNQIPVDAFNDLFQGKSSTNHFPFDLVPMRKHTLVSQYTNNQFNSIQFDCSNHIILLI